MANEKLLRDLEESVPTIVVPVVSEEEKSKYTSVLLKRKKQGSSKKSKNKPLKKEKKKKVRVLSQTTSILPFLRYEDNHVVLKDGVMDILQISSIDLDSLNQSDELSMIYQRVRFVRSYVYDYKEISLNFPADTSMQQEYWRKKLEQASDPIDQKYIKRKLFELEFVEEKRTNREFFLFIFADNEDQLKERRRNVEALFKTSFPLMRITKEKKLDVLCKLNNQNSKL